MYWLPIRCGTFLDDYFQLQLQGFRLTRDKRTQRPRYYNGWTAHRNSTDIWMVPNWWRLGIDQRPVSPQGTGVPRIARYLYERDLLLINVDEHWGPPGRHMRTYLIGYCENVGHKYMCVSFDALRMANVATETVEPIFIEPLPKNWLWSGRLSPECTFKGLRLGKPVRYISGWDHNDRIPRYFIAELPERAKAHTMEAARRALAPPIVREAWNNKIPVVRQGDVFAIKTEMTEKDLVPLMKYRAVWRQWWPIAQNWNLVRQVRYRPYRESPEEYRERRRYNREQDILFRERRDTWEDMAQRMMIHGTAHTATEVIRLKDGRMFGKGMLRHDPNLLSERRARDHQNVRLDDGKDGWWLFARNTVPPARSLLGRPAG